MLKTKKEGIEMTIIIQQKLKSGVRTTTGKLISDSIGVITAAVLNSQGSYSIRRFQKAKIANYVVVE